MPMIKLIEVKLAEISNIEMMLLNEYYEEIDDYRKELIYRDYIMQLGRETMLRELLMTNNEET